MRGLPSYSALVSEPTKNLVFFFVWGGVCRSIFNDHQPRGRGLSSARKLLLRLPSRLKWSLSEKAKHLHSYGFEACLSLIRNRYSLLIGKQYSTRLPIIILEYCYVFLELTQGRFRDKPNNVKKCENNVNRMFSKFENYVNELFFWCEWQSIYIMRFGAPLACFILPSKQ